MRPDVNNETIIYIVGTNKYTYFFSLKVIKFHIYMYQKIYANILLIFKSCKEMKLMDISLFFSIGLMRVI